MDILAVVPRVYVSTLQPHLDVYKVLLKQEAPHKFQINQTHVARFSNLLLIADENNVITNQVAVTIVTIQMGTSLNILNPDSKNKTQFHEYKIKKNPVKSGFFFFGLK
ncbi:hypothetical protein [Bacillus pseudomycoides]|uniref:hypothetical protein n=1 Tax=Bacillus pseudomycoides TaxID=64104 RepID=UPI00211D2ED8|nr:hypothetical protein [Bacillus pseudomycoides]